MSDIPRTTVKRTLNEITVRVYDKSVGRRVVTARAVMLALRGETIKMIHNRYPNYVFEVRRD